jgi:hypothetical protein
LIALLSQQWGEAGGSLSLGNAGDGWEQPRQSQGGSALPDGPCLVSKTGRCTQGTGVVKPLHRRPAQNPVDLGGIAVRTRMGSRQPGGGPIRGTGGTVRVPGLTGRGEGLRRNHDETAGAKPGTSPVDRKAVNVGTIGIPFPLGIGALPAQRCR